MSYTSGPWRYSTKPQPNGCPIIGDMKGLMVAMLGHSVNDAWHYETAIANAKLISAAPELLEALEELVSVLGDCSLTENARKVISKVYK